MPRDRKVRRGLVGLLVAVAALSCAVWATGCGPSRAEKERAEAELRERNEEDQRSEELRAKANAERDEANHKAAEEVRVREEAEAKREAEEALKIAAERKKLDDIRDEANKLPKLDDALPARPTGLKGKALILDGQNEIALILAGRSDGEKSLQDELPDDLKGKPDDPDLVVFVVAAAEKYQTKTYEEADDEFGGKTTSYPGYRLDHKVRVVAWPTKTLLGDFMVTGDDPPRFVNIDPNDHKDITGDDKAPLKRWVTGRFGETPALEKFLAATDDREAHDLAEAVLKEHNDFSTIPYLAKKLKESSGDVRYEAIRLLRELSAVATQLHTLGGVEVGGRFGFAGVAYPMGPESAEEFDQDPDGWVTKWLSWASSHR